jgi:hypothetical protein
MIGARSLRPKGRLSGASAAALLGLSFACAYAIGPAEADKVGVAAAVNPDAFSSLAGAPQSQLNIGKSIFYNERINTTGSGLVQVLLVDGSTFTVGPGSDLVIDKFVYDPKKGTGQIAASFSKGVMRFVGGKLSKNDGGVTVDTPAGALAIRGGISYMDFKSPKNFSILFVFGEYLKLGGSTLYQPGYGWFMNNGLVTTREFNATDLAGIMAALTNGNAGAFANNSNTGPKPGSTLLNTTSLAQLISDANATQIQAEIDAQLALQASGQPTENLSQGYAAGMFIQTGDGDSEPIGSLTNLSPSQVALLFNGPDSTFSGASFTLFVDGGTLEYVDDVLMGKGGAKIVFSPITLPDTIPGGLPEGVDLFAGGATSEVLNAITAYYNTVLSETGQPELADPANPTEGQALLVGVSGAGEAFCEGCNFFKWGAWVASVEFPTDPGSESNTHAAVAGWWISGDLPTIGQLPFQGTASYDGRTLGTVAAYMQTCEFTGWTTYVASGDVHMEWDFGQHAGILEIMNFDANGPYGPLNVSGRMDVPGQLANSATNKFSGPLHGTLGQQNYQYYNELPPVEGGANGSFVAKGSDKTAGVIGNWFAGNEYYKATGVFGAGRVGDINPNGQLDLPPRYNVLSSGPHD